MEHARERLGSYLSRAREMAGSVKNNDKKDGLLKVCNFFEQEAGGNI